VQGVPRGYAEDRGRLSALVAVGRWRPVRQRVANETPIATGTTAAAATSTVDTLRRPPGATDDHDGRAADHQGATGTTKAPVIQAAAPRRRRRRAVRRGARRGPTSHRQAWLIENGQVVLDR